MQSSVNVVSYDDMAIRPMVEKLNILRYVNSDLHDAAVAMEFGKLQMVLNGLTNERLSFTIDLILEKYNDLYLSDIILFVKLLARGEYERPFGVPTPDYLCRCFQEYYVGRENARAQCREQQHRRTMDRLYKESASFDYEKMKKEAQEKRDAPKEKSKPVLNVNQFKAEDFKKEEL